MNKPSGNHAANKRLLTIDCSPISAFAQYFGAKETRFFMSPLRGSRIFGKTWFLRQIIEQILISHKIRRGDR
jgi:hypothetical protein